MLLISLVAASAFAPLGFLVGDWCGSGLGGEVVERWSRPIGNAMTGSFTATKDGHVSFHEFWAVVATDDGIAIRLKHFDPDLSSWEAQKEATVFPLERATANAAYFTGLVYEQPTPDTLTATVDTSNGTLHIEFVRCTLGEVPSAAP